MNMFELLNNDNQGFTEEEKTLADNFNNKLRDMIIDELVLLEGEELISLYKSDRERFNEKIEEIFVNGKKGYKNIPTKTLIDIFIHRKSEVDFINLIEGLC